MSLSGIAHLRIREHPIAVVDLETTGLAAGYDRVVEIAVLRLEPDGTSRVVLDSLINPRRPVGGTEIHGITDEDVADAPIFAEVTDPLFQALSGCIVCAYNVYFDVRFLETELHYSGERHYVPHFCLMYMRPLLGLGSKCTLEKACTEHGLSIRPSHCAAEDVGASGELLKCYLKSLGELNIHTYGDLTRRAKKYKFFESFLNDPLARVMNASSATSTRFKSRSRHQGAARVEPPKNPLAVYWDELRVAVADLHIDDEEIETLNRIRFELRIGIQDMRFLHANLFGTVMQSFGSDRRISKEEAETLRKLHLCLRKLGWAPGD